VVEPSAPVASVKVPPRPRSAIWRTSVSPRPLVPVGSTGSSRPASRTVSVTSAPWRSSCTTTGGERGDGTGVGVVDLGGSPPRRPRRPRRLGIDVEDCTRATRAWPAGEAPDTLPPEPLKDLSAEAFDAAVDDYLEANADQLLFSKLLDWSGEQEFRFVAVRQHDDSGPLDVSFEDSLRAVICGHELPHGNAPARRRSAAKQAASTWCGVSGTIGSRRSSVTCPVGERAGGRNPHPNRTRRHRAKRPVSRDLKGKANICHLSTSRLLPSAARRSSGATR
jgi:hypothetical protein